MTDAAAPPASTSGMDATMLCEDMNVVRKSYESEKKVSRKLIRTPDEYQGGDERVRGRALNEAERRQIMHMLDLQETYKNSDSKTDKLTYKKIAELTGKHINTVAKMKRERDRQNCVRVQGPNGIRTVDVPAAGKQGGFRWCRMNEEQKKLCTRFAIENPRLTAAQIRDMIVEHYPGMTLSESTVWRTLHASNLQFLRAKMKDPRAEGTMAHRNEKSAFLDEQKKGEAGELGALDMFFMDETTLYLNEVTRRAWGTSEQPAEIKKSKGKTLTIGLYAGLGLVSNRFDAAEWHAQHRLFDKITQIIPDQLTVRVENPPMENWVQGNKGISIHHTEGGNVTDVLLTANTMIRVTKENTYEYFFNTKDRAPVAPDDPRGNDYTYADGRWTRVETPPQFMLFWWIRPPMRSGTVLSRFLNSDDILDPNFTVAIQKNGQDKEFSLFKEDAHGEPDIKNVEAFLAYEFEKMVPDDLAKMLWLNNIEWREVNEDGSLRNVVSATNTKKTHKILLSPEQMLKHINNLKHLVARTVMSSLSSEGHTLLPLLKRWVVDDSTMMIPRAYYSKTGRQSKGGRIESERGDQALFLNYLEHETEYVKRAFPATVNRNSRKAFDAAAQHGRTSVDSFTKSFIHEYVERKFNIRGAIFLPVREPDFNPTELLFSFIKGVVRRRMPSSVGQLSEDEMVHMIDQAFMEVTEDMVKGWLRYGCYLIPGEDPSAVIANKRCEYPTTVDVKSILNELLLQWEHESKQLIPLNIKTKLLAFNDAWRDDGALHAIAARFPTVFDAFGGSGAVKRVFYGLTVKNTVRSFSCSTDIRMLYPNYENDASERKRLCARLFLVEKQRMESENLPVVDLMEPGILNEDSVFCIDSKYYQNKIYDAQMMAMHLENGIFTSSSTGSVVRVTDIRENNVKIVSQTNEITAQLVEPWSREQPCNMTIKLVDPFVGGLVVLGENPGTNIFRIRNPPNLNPEINIPLTNEVELEMEEKNERYGDNFKSEAYKRLHRIIRTRYMDDTGFEILRMYLQNKALSPTTVAALAKLSDVFNESQGLLFVLNQSAMEVASIFNQIPIARPQHASKVDMLLDLQERVFHPKLDMNTNFQLIAHTTTTTETTKIINIDYTDKMLKYRTVGNSLKMPCCEKKTTHSTEAEGMPEGEAEVLFTVVSIDSKHAVATGARRQKIKLANIRLCDAVEANTGEIDKIGRRIKRLLQETPYKTSIPSEDEPLFGFGVAVIAQKAYNKERERMNTLVKKCVNQILGELQDANNTVSGPVQEKIYEIISHTLKRWERNCSDGNGNCVTERGQIVQNTNDTQSLVAKTLPPHYNIPHLRADRRAALQISLLSKGESEGRRWPGYPASEREGRDGKKFTVVQPGDRVNVDPPKIVKSVFVKQTIRPKGSKEEYIDAKIVYEDNSTDELLPLAFAKTAEVPTEDNVFERMRNMGFDNVQLVEKERIDESAYRDSGNPNAVVGIFKPARAPSTDTLDMTSVFAHGSQPRRFYYNYNIHGYKEKYTQTFGRYAHENQMKLQLALQRYNERDAKTTKKLDAFPSSPPLHFNDLFKSNDTAIAVYKGKALKVEKDKYVGDEHHALFDPTTSIFYPSITKAYDTYILSKQWKRPFEKMKIGLLDMRVLHRTIISPYWICTEDTKDHDKIVEMPGRFNPLRGHANIFTPVLDPPGGEKAEPFRLVYKYRRPRESVKVYVPTWKTLVWTNNDQTTASTINVSDFRCHSLGVWLTHFKLYKIPSLVDFFNWEKVTREACANGFSIQNPALLQYIEKKDTVTWEKAVFNTKISITKDHYVHSQNMYWKPMLYDMYKSSLTYSTDNLVDMHVDANNMVHLHFEDATKQLFVSRLKPAPAPSAAVSAAPLAGSSTDEKYFLFHRTERGISMCMPKAVVLRAYRHKSLYDMEKEENQQDVFALRKGVDWFEDHGKIALAKTLWK